MITLITGGSGSGKSAYAEDTILSYGDGGNRIYIATMFPFDEESRRRIDRHRRMRQDKQFQTIERYTDLAGLQIPEDSYALLECMSNLAANEMYREDGAGVNAVPAILKGIENLSAQAKELCIVTNEISSDGNPYDREMQKYQCCLGTINQAIARQADQVIEVVYGLPVIIKGKIR